MTAMWATRRRLTIRARGLRSASVPARRARPLGEGLRLACGALHLRASLASEPELQRSPRVSFPPVRLSGTNVKTSLFLVENRLVTGPTGEGSYTEPSSSAGEAPPTGRGRDWLQKRIQYFVTNPNRPSPIRIPRNTQRTIWRSADVRILGTPAHVAFARRTPPAAWPNTQPGRLRSKISVALADPPFLRWFAATSQERSGGSRRSQWLSDLSRASRFHEAGCHAGSADRFDPEGIGQ